MIAETALAVQFVPGMRFLVFAVAGGGSAVTVCTAVRPGADMGHKPLAESAGAHHPGPGIRVQVPGKRPALRDAQRRKRGRARRSNGSKAYGYAPTPALGCARAVASYAHAVQCPVLICAYAATRRR
eukprot:3636072-Rhodomonas_salina.2